MRLFAALATSVVVACTAPETPSAPASGRSTFEQSGCRISRVVDGDTITITCPDTARRNVRLTGFDTPETYKPQCAGEERLGQAATLHLRHLIAQASMVDLRTSGTDRYGRLLGRLALDGVDVARAMIAEGLAVPYSGGKRRNWCV